MDEIIPGTQINPDLERVQQLEAQMLQMPQLELETRHLIHGGMYARTIFLPAGTAAVGALLNLDNICIIAGDMSVTTDDGPVRLTGYHVLSASAGFKRIGYAHTDTYLTTLYPTTLTTVAEIEDEMTDEADRLQTRRAALRQQDISLIEGE